MIPRIIIGQAYQHALEILNSISDTPALDAQMLLANAMNRSRTWIVAHPEVELEAHEEQKFLISLSRYKNGESLPYILGWWEFYGRRFQVNNSVLIPRPETEHLVESAVSYLRSNPGARKALDVGTGSGCIALSLAREVNDLVIIATDISWEALQIARMNARELKVDSRVRFVQMDLDLGLVGGFDVVCANLPYIPSAILQNLDVGKREPNLALDGGIDGYRYIRPMLRSLPDLLLPGGCALLELETGTGEAVLQMAKSYLKSAKLKLLQDLAGHDRVLFVQN